QKRSEMFNGNYFVYITTNPKRTALYIGVTNDLQRRLQEHFNNCGNKATFAGRYYCYRVLYVERFDNAASAIDREKQLKNWSREKKLNLIKKTNPLLKFINDQIEED